MLTLLREGLAGAFRGGQGRERTSDDGDDVGEVTEDVFRALRHACEGKEAEQGRETEGVDGDAVAVGVCEDLGRLAFARKAVKCSGGDVKIRVGGGEDKDQDTGVYDMGQCWDLLHGGDKGRGSGGVGGLGREGQVVRVVRNQHADEEHAEDIEDDNAPEGQLDRLGDCFARVLRLSDGHSDQFGTC